MTYNNLPYTISIHIPYRHIYHTISITTTKGLEGPQQCPILPKYLYIGRSSQAPSATPSRISTWN